MMKPKQTKSLRGTQGLISLLASLLSIMVGLLVGLALLSLLNPAHAFSGFLKILTTGLATTEKMAKVLYQAMPLMLCGLAVAFAFKTGLFNIGAAGQYTMGAFCALTVAIALQQPWYIALIAAALGGALLGAIPGICKALFNVNEVITSIMFNWITMYAVNLTINNMPIMLTNYWSKSTIKDRTAPLMDANPAGILPKGGLDTLMNSNYINIGIFIAIGVAIVIWIILQKTVLGYELKACGYNRHASQYAGINAKRNIVLSMIISGALAGLGGGLYYLSGTGQYTLVKVLLGMGFNGIPVALLASSNPLGVIFSSLFISYIQVGGDALQPHFIKENIDIIISAIIYLSAFALLMKGWIAKLILRGSPRNANLEVPALNTAEASVSDPDTTATAQAAQKEDAQ
ncbi:MAG: ABC transporter permease [Candidatus Limiplasma sp.]|nr:ABC transporter permease [Candidatus Limiplasma sp.]MEA5146297.1 ABC transporter permease [Candidatus Limiplasma sp.]